MVFEKISENRIKNLNDDLKVRQEIISLLKGRLTNEITGIKEMIAKILDKDTSLAEKIRTLFMEQGITIASVLVAIGLAIDVVVEVLLPSGGAMTQIKAVTPCSTHKIDPQETDG